MNSPKMDRLEQVAADLDRQMERAREAYDTDPSPEKQRVISQLRAEQRDVAGRILKLEHGDQD